MNWLDELEVEEERWKFAIKDRPNLIAKKEKEVSLKHNNLNSHINYIKSIRINSFNRYSEFPNVSFDLMSFPKPEVTSQNTAVNSVDLFDYCERSELARELYLM